MFPTPRVCPDTGTLPMPADLYAPHEYLPNDFGECLGCGLDGGALCHLEPEVPATLTA